MIHIFVKFACLLVCVHVMQGFPKLFLSDPFGLKYLLGDPGDFKRVRSKVI